jgi:hypothetical protein
MMAMFRSVIIFLLDLAGRNMLLRRPARPYRGKSLSHANTLLGQLARFLQGRVIEANEGSNLGQEGNAMMTEGQKAPAELKARRAVRIHVTGGTVMEGNLVVPKTRGVGELLNGKRPFLEFEASNGDKIFISKPSIQTVQMLDLPKSHGSCGSA